LTPTIARWVQSPSLLPLACCGEPSCSDAFPTRRSSDLDYENYRIGFVEMRAIAGANTGYRKLSFSIEIDGNVFVPAANDIRDVQDRKSTRLNSSHVKISYAVFGLKKKIKDNACVLR